MMFSPGGTTQCSSGVVRHSTSSTPGRLVLKTRKRRKTLLRPRCSECKLIEWSNFVPRNRADVSDMLYEMPLFEMFPDSTPGQRSCPTCDLLVDLGQAYVTNNPETIYACSAAKVFLSDEVNEVLERNSNLWDVTQWATVLTSGAIGVRQNAILGILHPGSYKEKYAPRIINPYSIDYGVIRGWVQRCSAHPNRDCTPSRKKNLLGFKVIHCRSRNVIEAPDNCPYVALSYVWGTAPFPAPEYHGGRFPTTIEDSIVVSLALGFEYLWVDRYCIDQMNDDDKHHQVSQMHCIYSEASLTIVAAAGDNPDYGLPGVGSRSRRPQKLVQIGDHALVEMFPYTCSNLQSSRWGSRAWTYQEGFLSSRRLIFDDQQVSFVCADSFYAESFTHRVEHQQINENLNFSSLFFNTVDRQRWRPDKLIRECVEEYTKRNLSYDGDALSACLGIFNRFLDSYGGAQLWGATLLGYKGIMDLAWYHPSPVCRRDNFPSWSWLGWKGPVRHNSRWGSELFVLHIQVPVNDQWMSSEDYFLSGMNRTAKPCDAPRFLKLTGSFVGLNLLQAVPPAFKDVEECPGDGFYALLPLSDHLSQVLRVYPDCDGLEQDDLVGCVALVAGLQKWTHLSWHFHCLLLKPVGDRLQRVGLASSIIPGLEPHQLLCDRSGRIRMHDDSVDLRGNYDITWTPFWERDATEGSVVVG